MNRKAASNLAEWIDRQAQMALVRRRDVTIVTVAFFVLLLTSIVVVAIVAPDSLPRVLEYEGVGLAGGLVGLAELVSRYRDHPLSAVTSWPGLGYVAINAVASLGALILIFAFDWKFGASGQAVLLTQLLVASFGAMALFRTSLFTVRAGDQDIGIGPSSLLSIILDACDRGVDRVRAKSRAWEVARVMTDVSYERAQGPLPAVAVALMQNLPDSDQAALGVDLERLAQANGLSPESKSLLLGLAIADQVGPHVLEAAKLTLGEKIKLGADDERGRTGRIETAPGEVVEALASAPGIEGRIAALGATGEDGGAGDAERAAPRRAPKPRKQKRAGAGQEPPTPPPDAPDRADEPSSRASGLPQTPQTP